MRYVTCGDWETLPDHLKITVAGYGGRADSEFLVALHELIESYLCKSRGIIDAAVTAWDLSHVDAEEPGDIPGAPYYHEHVAATAMERYMALELGIDWDQHETWVQSAANEVDRALKAPVSAITIAGPRAWAELHLFALRHDGSRDNYWLDRWVKSLNFEGCPCEQHLREYLEANPPDWSNLFDWSIALHNSVNERVFKPTIDATQARELWMRRSF